MLKRATFFFLGALLCAQEVVGKSPPVAEETCSEEVAIQDPERPLMDEKGQVDSLAFHRLSELARGGDPIAQSRIIEALYEVLPRYITSLQNQRKLDREDVDDAIQKVLMRVISRNYDYNFYAGNEGRTSHFTTWLFWYVKTSCKLSLDQQRQSPESNFARPGENDEGVSLDILSNGSRPEVSEREVWGRLEESILTEVMPLLPAEEAKLFQMQLEGRTNAEMAEAFQVSEGTIVKRKKESHQNVRALYKLVEDGKYPQVRKALAHLETRPLLKDIFVDHFLLTLSWHDIQRRRQAWKEGQLHLIRLSYLRAVQFMAYGAAEKYPENQLDFWEEISIASPEHREALERLTRFYVEQDRYPDSDSTGRLFEDLGFTADQVFGKSNFAPTAGPNISRLFMGDAHMYWALTKHIQREFQRTEKNFGRSPATEKLRNFDPFLLPVPTKENPFHPAYLQTLEEFRPLHQAHFIERVLRFCREKKRFPETRQELSDLYQVPYLRIFGFGAPFLAGGRFEGMASFNGIPEYERLLHGRRLMRIHQLHAIKTRSVAEDKELLDLIEIGKLSLSLHSLIFSELPQSFKDQFPQVTSLFSELPVRIQNYAYQRFVLRQPRERIVHQCSLSAEEVYLLEGDFFRAIFQKVPAGSTRPLVQELLTLPGLFREMTELIVEDLKTKENLPSIEEESVLVKSKLPPGISSERILKRLFPSRSFKAAVLCIVAHRKAENYQRALPEDQADPDTLEQWNRLELLTPQRFVRELGFANSSDELFQAIRSESVGREKRRLARVVLTKVLETNEAPTFNNIIKWTSSDADSLFGEKAFFPSQEDFYQTLFAEAAFLSEAKPRRYTEKPRNQLRLLSARCRANFTKNDSTMSLEANRLKRAPQTEEEFYWEKQFSHMTRIQSEVFYLFHFEKYSWRVISHGLGQTAKEVQDHYFKAVNSVFLYSEKTPETLRTLQTQLFKLKGPHSDIVAASWQHFEKTGELPTMETITQRLPAPYQDLSVDQLWGTGEFAANANGPTARVFIGMPQFAWAFHEFSKSQPDSVQKSFYSPFFLFWKLPVRRGTLDDVNIEFFTPEERARAQERVKARALERLRANEPVTLELLAADFKLPPEALAGQKEFREKAAHGYRRVFPDGTAFKDFLKSLK